MSDQQFVNAYIRILNDTLNEAMSKNLVMQAQLEVSKQVGARVAELEAKIKEFSGVSSSNNELQSQLNNLKAQLEQTNSQLTNKNNHIETFKRELIDARNIIKAQTTEIELLKKNIEELKPRAKKRAEKTAVNTVESNFIAVSDTF